MNEDTQASPSLASVGGRADYFATTRWTLVHAAALESPEEARVALAELCQVYWYPLYTFVRRQVSSREDAEDLVQSFFESFLARNNLAGLDAAQGKFRSFLLACLKHHVANARTRERRIKRGGGVLPLSLDWQSAEHRFIEEPKAASDPEKDFDREWALALLATVLGLLRRECEAEGRLSLFESTKQYLTCADEGQTYAEAAAELNKDAGAVRVAVHRLRKRYRYLLKREIERTLLNPDDAAVELQSLAAALTS